MIIDHPATKIMTEMNMQAKIPDDDEYDTNRDEF